MFYRGCFEDGPMVLFNEPFKDMKKNFWFYVKNFGFPEFDKNLVEGVISMMDCNQELLHTLKNFLCGNEINVSDNHFLCRVHGDLVKNQKQATALVNDLFENRFQGKGYFRDTFMKLNYRITPQSLKVEYLPLQKALDRYSLSVPNRTVLKEYRSVLDIQFDVSIKLAVKLPEMNFDSNEKKWNYSEKDISVYSALKLFLEHSDEIVLERRFRCCRRKPQNLKECNDLFLENLSRDISLNIYNLAQFLHDFSNDSVVVEKLSHIPKFEENKNMLGSYNLLTRGGLTSLKGRGFYNFDYSITVAFCDSVGYYESIGILERMQFFLQTHISECKEVLMNPKFEIPYDWGNVRIAKFGSNEIHVKYMSANRSYLRRNKNDIPAVKNFLQEFKSKLEEMYNTLGNFKDAISRIPSIRLQDEIGQMILRSVQMDPFTFSTYPVRSIREYATSLINGTV